MEPPSPPPEDTPRPPTAYVVCAACGPLTPPEARAAGIVGEEEGQGLCLRQREYRVEQQPTLAQLHSWLAQDPAAREGMEAVENLRSRPRESGSPSHGMLAARARYALLSGRQALFRNCYRRYVQVEEYQWHPDRRHFDFWDSVLGVGWQGSDAVPPGAARAEIAALTHTCCAFTAYPAGAVPIAPKGEMAEVAAALRAADTGTLRRLKPKSGLADAALVLLQGDWFEAAWRFVRELGSNDCLMPERRGALPLMPYALLAAVLAGLRAGIVRCWLEGTRSMLTRAFPASQAAQQRELGLFLDHLEYLDKLVNRRGNVDSPEGQGGAVAQLPLLLGCRALPASLRDRLQGPEAIAELNALGLPCLAAFAAAGLRNAGLGSGSGTGQPHYTLPSSISTRAERFLDILETAVGLARRPSRLLTVRGGNAELNINSRAQTIELRLAGLPPHPEPALRQLELGWQIHAQAGVVELGNEELPRLLPLLEALQGTLRVEGRLALPGQEVRPAAPVPVLALSHLGGGTLLAALRLRLLPGAAELVQPGSGLAPCLLHLRGEQLTVQRDLEAERQLQAETLDRLYRAGGLPANTRVNAGAYWLEGLPAASDLLRACEKLGLECLWEKGHELALRRVRSLSLHTTRQGSDWFELGARCEVDDGEILKLTQLLDASSRREGDFIPLPDGAYLHLQGRLAQQIALLELLCAERGPRKTVGRAALALLSPLFGEHLEPPVPPPPPPPGLRANLRPYQQDGYAWLAARAEAGIGCLLADDMGLGKTLQTIALLLQQAPRGGDTPSLVIAPTSLLGNWEAESARFAPCLRVHTLDRHRKLPGLGAGDILLASYGQLTSRLAELRQQHWNILVLDEAQNIKNPGSQRARAACALSARARLCLTGTPIENSLLDLWSEMHFLNTGLLGARASFSRRHSRADTARRAELRALLAPLVLRRRKNDVLQQLPPLTDMLVHVELSREERALYESLRRRAKENLEQSPSTRIALLAELTRLRRACCHGRLALPEFAGASSKLSALADLAEERHNAGHRLLIFSQFTDVLDLAETKLAARGLDTLRLDGSTPAPERTQRVQLFQQGRADAFLISLKAGGAGLNLTAADYVILIDPWWNPAAELQAAGRSHRIGQGRPVTLCRLIVRDSVEERILELQRDKRELADSILEPDDSGPPSLDTLRALLD